MGGFRPPILAIGLLRRHNVTPSLWLSSLETVHRNCFHFDWTSEQNASTKTSENTSTSPRLAVATTSPACRPFSFLFSSWSCVIYLCEQCLAFLEDLLFFLGAFRLHFLSPAQRCQFSATDQRTPVEHLRNEPQKSDPRAPYLGSQLNPRLKGAPSEKHFLRQNGSWILDSRFARNLHEDLHEDFYKISTKISTRISTKFPRRFQQNFHEISKRSKQDFKQVSRWKRENLAYTNTGSFFFFVITLQMYFEAKKCFPLGITTDLDCALF